MTSLSPRRSRLLAAAREHTSTACEAVLVCSAARHSLLAMDGVWWATGFKPMGECAVGIAPDGSARLWVSPDWDAPRAEYQADAGVMVTAAGAGGSVFGAAGEWLSGLGIPAERLLVCGSERLAAHQYRELRHALGSACTPGDRLLLEVARNRDAAELALAGEAVRIAELAYERLLAELRPGLDEFEVVASLDALLRELGSEDNFVLVSASRRNRSVHPPTDRMIAAGDVLLAEISPACSGVFTQICRSVTIGTATPQVCDDYDLLMAALRAGMAAARPGEPVAAAVTAMDEVLGQAGFADYCRPPYMRARGHALALGSSLPGDVTRASTEEFCEGDYLVLHPNQYLPTSGYLLCGEPVLIEAAGATPLSSAFGQLGQVAG